MGEYTKPFKAGNSYVLYIPVAILRSLQLKEGDLLKITPNDKGLIVEKCDKEGKNVVKLRQVGANKYYPVYGFTIPFNLAKKIKNWTFKKPVILEKREDGYFKLLFERAKLLQKSVNPA